MNHIIYFNEELDEKFHSKFADKIYIDRTPKKQISPANIVYTRLQPIEYERLPNLEYVVTPCTGIDHIDQEYCNKNNIKIISLKGETKFLENIYATAEHTIALILALARKIPQAHNSVCRGEWERQYYTGTELGDKTLGIIGMGRIGKQVANIAKVFGMKILYYDKKFGLKRHLIKLLKESDIITVHVPYNEETTGLISREEFELMKDTTYLINTSRSNIVNGEDLLTALWESKIAGAAIDVMEGYSEKIRETLIYYAEQNEDLIITPHIGGNTYESRYKTDDFIIGKLLEMLSLLELAKECKTMDNKRTIDDVLRELEV